MHGCGGAFIRTKHFQHNSRDVSKSPLSVRSPLFETLNFFPFLVRTSPFSALSLTVVSFFYCRYFEMIITALFTFVEGEKYVCRKECMLRLSEEQKKNRKTKELKQQPFSTTPSVGATKFCLYFVCDYIGG